MGPGPWEEALLSPTGKEATKKCHDIFDVQGQPSAALRTTEGGEARLGVSSLGIDSQEEMPDWESGIRASLVPPPLTGLELSSVFFEKWVRLDTSWESFMCE